MKKEVDLNNSDNTEGQSLSTEGVNLVPNDQVRLEYTEEYNMNLVPNCCNYGTYIIFLTLLPLSHTSFSLLT